MANPKIPNQKNKYNQLNNRLAGYVALVRQIYDTLNLEAAKMAERVGYSGEKPFSFRDYPQLSDGVSKIQKKFVSDIGSLIYTGTTREWRESNLVQDLVADAVLKAYNATTSKKTYTKYYQTNSSHLKAFQERKDRGLNLSSKIWKQSVDYKEELESAISSAIEKGMSAVTLSKRISKYLNDFESLQKDYKGRFGTAVKCKDCEYASIRLARSEINMAYRTAEQKRWEQMDFIVGYEIKLSHTHHAKMPHGDICDDLSGKYPKDFKWTGWHPNDMCYVVPILKTEEEFWADENVKSSNEVTDVPEKFKRWIDNNNERIENARTKGTLPYFIKDNNRYVIKNNKEITYVPKYLNEVVKKQSSDAAVAFISKGEFNSLDDFLNSTGYTRQELQSMLNNAIENSDIYMSIDASVLENKVIKGDKKFKSSIETGKGTFKTIGEERLLKEREMFGLDGVEDYDNIPKYGFLSAKGQMGNEDIVGWGYGDTYVCFKKDAIRPRATFTVGDSYDGNKYMTSRQAKSLKEMLEFDFVPSYGEKSIEARKQYKLIEAVEKEGDKIWTRVSPASPVNSPKVESLMHMVGRKDNWASSLKIGVDEIAARTGAYIECQMYGKVTLDDVARIEVCSIKKKASLEKILKKNGYDIPVVASKYDYRLKKILEGSWDDKDLSYICSLRRSDIDALGDRYIDKIFYKLAPNGRTKNDYPEILRNFVVENTQMGKNIPIKDKREWLEKAFESFEDGTFRPLFQKLRKKNLVGFIDDVLNKELLK